MLVSCNSNLARGVLRHLVVRHRHLSSDRLDYTDSVIGVGHSSDVPNKVRKLTTFHGTFVDSNIDYVAPGSFYAERDIPTPPKCEMLDTQPKRRQSFLAG